MPFRHLAAIIVTLSLAAPAAAQVEEQVITGSRLPQPVTGNGNVRTVIDRQQIEASGLAYVSDLLRGLPGIAVAQTGGPGGFTQVRLRGAEANQLTVLIDGVKAVPAGGGAFDFSSLLAEDVQSITLVRGALSGVYGSGAMAGVIEITTRGGGPGGISGTLEGGSYGTAAQSATARLSKGTGFLTLSLAHRASKGFSVAPGGTERDGNHNLTLTAKGGVDVSDSLRLEGNLRRVGARVETDDQDFSGGPLQGQIIDSNSYSRTTDLTAGLTAALTQAGGASVTSLALTYGRSEAGGNSGGDYGSLGQRRRVTLSSRYGFGGGALRHQVLFFAETLRETYRNTMPFDASQAPEEARTLWAVGGEYRLQAGPMTLSAALRHDINDAFADATTGRLAAAWDVGMTGSRLHASFGTGVTNPTFFEQFGFLPSSFTGNPDLTPEKSTGWDAGITQNFLGEDLVIDLTYFESRLSDEIMSLYPSVINAAGESPRSGLEATLTARPVESLTARAAYTLVNAKDGQGRRALSRPRVSASLGLTYAPEAGRLSLDLEGTYTGAQLNNDYTAGFTPARTWLDEYVLINAAATFRLSPAVSVYVRGQNLADVHYQEVLGYATAGRAVFAGLRLWHGL